MNDYNAIADALIDCQTEISLWQQRRETLLKQLTAAHEQGEIPTKWKRNDYSFTLSPGRRTVVYGDKAKLALENFKQSCLESGDATEKMGEPFWTVRVAK